MYTQLAAVEQPAVVDDGALQRGLDVDPEPAFEREQVGGVGACPIDVALGQPADAEVGQHGTQRPARV